MQSRDEEIIAPRKPDVKASHLNNLYDTISLKMSLYIRKSFRAILSCIYGLLFTEEETHPIDLSTLAISSYLD